MKLSSAGAFQWAFSIGGGGDDVSLSVTVNTTGYLCLTGYFQGTVDFDPGAGTYAMTAAGNDMFLAAYTAAGNFLWAQKEGAAGDEAAYGIATDAQGFLYAAGYFSGTTNFETGLGTVALSSAGGNYAFILKYSRAVNAPLPVTFISFSGLRKGTDALLKWTTAENPANKEFILERTVKQNDQWQPVGVITAISGLNASYEFIDRNVPQTELFYRVKQIDRNGHSMYSKVIVMGNGTNNGIMLSQNVPNPASSITKIDYTLDRPSTLKFIVYDAVGRKVFETASAKGLQALTASA